MADNSREIRRAVDTGNALFGKKQAEKALLVDKAEAIVISRNAPKALRETISQYSGIAGTPMIEFGGTSIELGAVCGKPFPVSVMAVKSAGKSRLLQTGNENEAEKAKVRTRRKKKKKV